MSEQTTGDLVKQVSEAVGAVQEAHAQLVEGARQLYAHNSDVDAHGLNNPDSPFRKAVKDAAAETAESIVAGDVFKSTATKLVGDAIDQQLPVVLKSELHNPQSLINQSIGACVESVIDDKIKNGEISGGGSGKPTDPDKPDNPDNPDTPVIDPEKPDASDFWDKITDPTDTGTLESGDLYAAPTITAKPYWIKGALAGITLTPAEGMSVAPAQYELFVQGQSEIAEVTVNSEGTGIYNVQLPDSDGPAKLLLAAVAIDQYGNRSQMAKLILRIVNEDYVLLPEFITPAADGEAFSNEHAVWHVKAFKTLCGDESELHVNSRFRILNAGGQTLYDSYAVSETDQLELYAAATPGVAMTPDAEYYLEAQFKGITLGWSGWARRTVKVSRVATPVLTSPEADAEVIWPKGIAVTLSDFSLASGGLDIHSSTDWILCRDAELTDVVKVDAASSDLVSHSILPTDLIDGEIYYLSARFNAQASGASAWATPVAIRADDGYVKQASVTAPAANATIVFNDTGIVITTAPFATEGFADTHTATDYKVCTDVNGASAVLQALDSTDLLSHTFSASQCAGLSDGVTLYIFTRHKGKRIGWGEWNAPVAVKMKKGVVNTPGIATPAQNADVLALNNSITVTSTPFGVNAGNDAHSTSDWRLTSDAAGNNVIQQALNSADKTSHTFSGLNVAAGITTVYLWVRHHGSKFGASPWSAARPIRLSNAVTTPGGRKAYRHFSNEGTVIVVNDNNKTVHLLVADAKHRGKAKWDSVYTSSSNALDTSLTNYSNIPTAYFGGGSTALTTATAKTITDAVLNAHFGSNRDASTSKQNTDVLVGSYSSRAAAANFCRGKKINGVGCDLANIQLEARIYCEAEFLDSVDPTVAAYPANKLSGWNIAGAAYAWSSAEYGNANAWYVHSGGYCYNSYRKSYECAVVPVQEIAA